MATFPSLSLESKAIIIEEYDNSGDLRSPTDAGYIITRRMFTRTIKTFTIEYNGLNDTDHSTMQTFITNQRTTGKFTWTHPVTGTTHTVRFKRMPKLVKKGLYWSFTCDLEEV